MRSKWQCLVATILVLSCCYQVRGQNEASRGLYGKGVHAYYRGNVSAARQLLDQSIVYGNQDPRAYYFRGLTKLRTGDTLGAEEDFSIAANLEYTGNGSYDIGMTLSRIQGVDRVRLEEIRRDTRAAVRSRARPEPVQPIEPAVPQVAPQPYDEFDAAPPLDRQDDAAPGEELPADQGDPFIDDPIQPEDDSDDPLGFGTSSDEASAGTTDGTGVVSAVMRALFNAGGKAIPSSAMDLPIPGGGAPAPAAGDPSSDDAAAKVDPFGTDNDAADDPFGAEPTAEPADADDPFADDPTGDDDPFGDTDPPADDDPFGDTSPATDDDPTDTPADEDPFGDGGDDPFGDTGDDPFGEDTPGEDAPATEDDPFADGGDDPFGA